MLEQVLVSAADVEPWLALLVHQFVRGVPLETQPPLVQQVAAAALLEHTVATAAYRAKYLQKR